MSKVIITNAFGHSALCDCGWRSRYFEDADKAASALLEHRANSKIHMFDLRKKNPIIAMAQEDIKAGDYVSIDLETGKLKKADL